MANIDLYQDISKYSEVLGASQFRLTQMIIERLLSDLENALEMGLKNQSKERNQLFDHATEILCYMIRSINYNNDPEKGLQMLKLYSRMINLITQNRLNSDNKHKPLKQCIQITKNIKEGLELLSHG